MSVFCEEEILSTGFLKTKILSKSWISFQNYLNSNAIRIDNSTHIFHEGNKCADLKANIGVDNKLDFF